MARAHTSSGSWQNLGYSGTDLTSLRRFKLCNRQTPRPSDSFTTRTSTTTSRNSSALSAKMLAMGVLGTLFAGSYAAFGGGSKAQPASPPINASSSDEADFIKKFVEEAQAGEKNSGGAAKH
ncbi:hypothetical protein L209DRAFT_176889 [Thermothelomyces heterothallicus CBS 203.75]